MKKVLLGLIFGLCFMFMGIANAQPGKEWATYYGKFTSLVPGYMERVNSNTIVTDIAYDAQRGYIYVIGTTMDTAGIATPGSFQSEYHPHGDLWLSYAIDYPVANVFIAKFDTLGHRIWGTYYGGNKNAAAMNIVVDTSGDIYIAGITNSDSGMTTSGAFHSTFPNTGAYGRVAFLAKFSSVGQLIWGTYYGGRANGVVGLKLGLAYDKTSNNVYLANVTTDTSGIATSGSFQDHISMKYDTFVNQWEPTIDGYIARFNTNGQRVWGTYYGGEGYDFIKDLWVDGNGNVYALGQTLNDYSEGSLTTPGADQYMLFDSNSVHNSFLVKFDNGGQRLWGTYVGNGLTALSITGIDNGEYNGNVYVSGFINGNIAAGNITPNAYQPNYGGGLLDLLIASYNPSGVKQWSTFWGGMGMEPFDSAYYTRYYQLNNNLSVAPNGNLLMVNTTTSMQQQTLENSCHPYPTVHQKSFISQWQPTGHLLWSSYYDASLIAVCAGSSSDFYVGGYTKFDSLASLGSLQPTKVIGKPSGFIARFTSSGYCPPRDFSITIVNNRFLNVDSGFVGYQWYRQDTGLIVGANHFSYMAATDSGLFYVLITDSCGCVYSSDTVNLATATIEGLAKGNVSVKIYPNPSDGFFTLSGQFTTPNAVLYYSVTDVLGQTIIKSRLNIQNNVFSHTIDLSSYADGIYFLRLRNRDDFKEIKLIKKE